MTVKDRHWLAGYKKAAREFTQLPKTSLTLRTSLAPVFGVWESRGFSLTWYRGFPLTWYDGGQVDAILDAYN